MEYSVKSQQENNKALINGQESTNKRQFDIRKSKFMRLILDEYIKRKEMAELMKKNDDDLIREITDELNLIQPYADGTIST